ncbi:LamG-like jellyroll fold domain-containing protein [Dyadobacter pollutisoli]|uniref:T9SS type A sorting domain-containing protein n=1 Tax=Dyadobacter pollutisoli TaxID=2910158 RepID=A0A9E8NEV1_9BACT|nr:LamG-like jellyroll fold domain-containing protein [Dyadobacter pollutisoli]WAC13017.1 T9SS type A sorting domain-containing protein [Dyadobacter pollutisoli]
MTNSRLFFLFLFSLLLSLSGYQTTAEILAAAADADSVDVTDRIVNPSFESAFTGWTNDGLATQNNADFNPQKAGNTYVEKWVGSPPLPNVSISQKITGLANGQYTLWIGAQHITQNPLRGQPGGFVFGNDAKKEVGAKGEYAVDFLVVDGTARIGFKTENSKANWAACDNFRLYYKGVATDSMRVRLQVLVDSATIVSAKKMLNADRTALESALASAQQSLSQNAAGDELADRIVQLQNVLGTVSLSIDAFIGLQEAIDAADIVYGDGSGTGAATLLEVIDRNKVLVNHLDAALEDLHNGAEEIYAAILAFRLANASVASPLEMTQHIVNPSFESSFTGWINSGLATQSNADFNPQKAGSIYVEKWVGSPPLPNVSVSQKIVDLPNGKYALKIGAQHIAQNPLSGQPGGFVFANDAQTEVKEKSEYAVDFLVVDNTATIGFKTENSQGNWAACDNFRLYYQGAATDAIKEKLQALVDSATIVLNEKMQNAHRTPLQNAVDSGNQSLVNNAENEWPDRIVALQNTLSAAWISIEAYSKLQTAVDSAVAAYGDGSGNGAGNLLAVIDENKALVDHLDAALADVQKAPDEVYAAILAFRVANATGPAPVVVTDARMARGATMAFGRSTISGVEASRIREHGFCWSTSPQPTIFDNKTTSYFSNNGFIYRIENLQPATVYYLRAYAIGPNYVVGYGEVVKVTTIPKGNVTYQLQSSVTESGEHYPRIASAMQSAVDYYNNLTSISGHHLSVNYNAGTPTAEASYGGYMQFGASASYQRTGTALHEIAHTIGVGQHWIWYGPNSPLRAEGTRGKWLGERANKVVQFLDNDPAAFMTGDAVHMWPYGINGAHEDNNSAFLYTANALIVQALGEDGLPPTGGFATPAYTFDSDTSKYYIKIEDEKLGFNTSFLVENESGQLANKVISATDVLKESHAAWYVQFIPATGYYQIRNAATGKLFTYQGDNDMGLTASNLATTQSFQLMGARYNTMIGEGEKSFSAKAYWIVSPQPNMTPPTLGANADGSTSAVAFSFTDAAKSQRWFLLTGENVKSFESLLVAPTEIENLHVASGDAKIILTWDSSFGTSYDVFRAEAQNGTYTSVAENLSFARYEDTATTNGQTYHYKLVAHNDLGTSPESAILSGTPVKGQHLHLSFDENSGSIAYDDWGAFHAQLKNGATWSAGINVPSNRTVSNRTVESDQSALMLSETDRSYLQLDPGVVSTLSDFSLAAWVKLPENLGDNARLFDFGSGTDTYMAFAPKVGSNVWYQIRHASGDYALFIPYTIPANEWVHLAITQQDKTFRFFVNGKLIFTDQQATVKPSDLGVTTQNYLGRSQWSNDPYGNQALEDFRIYNFALSEQQMATLADANSLPVRLISFEGKADTEGNYLTWRTAEELNNDHFIVERAFNMPSNFQAIAQLKGKGTTALESDYQFIDTQARGRMAYYRLRQVDIDGTTDFSRIIAIDNRTLRPLNAYPNPAADHITVELPDASVARVHYQVFSVNGRLVLEDKQYLPNEGSVHIDTSRLPVGVYRIMIAKPVGSGFGATVIKR